MSTIEEMEKKEQKEKLREGMTTTPEPTEEELRQKRKKIGGFLWRLILLLIVFAVGGAWYFYRRQHEYEKTTLVLEKEVTITADDTFVAYRDFLLRYNRNGITCLDADGDLAFAQSYEMAEPHVVVNGDYAVVYDYLGTELYILGPDGATGHVETILPMRLAAVGGNGVLCLTLDNGLSDLSYFYDRTGRKMDIEMKTLMTEDGYAMDMAMSPDGQQQISAYVYLDQGSMLNQVVFRNFGEEGQEKINRLVGGFREYGSNLIGKVLFLSDKTACAFAEDRVVLYSMKNRTSPSEIKTITVSEELSGVIYDDSHIGLIFTDLGGSRVEIYDANGSKNATVKTTQRIADARFAGGYLVLYDNTHCALYNLYGELKYETDLGTDIRFLTCPAEKTILFLDGNIVKKIVLS